MKIPFNFEEVWNKDYKHGFEHLERAKVIGGWLVKYQYFECADINIPEINDFQMVFIPDPNHEWEIEENETAGAE